MNMEKGIIYFTKELYWEMVSHGKEAYPNECCGVLIGRFSQDGKKIFKVYRVDNKNVDRLKDRYSIDPRDILRIEKEIKGEGFEIIGFYHSHPDHPSRPSQFDRERAWPSYSYVIIAVDGSTNIDVRSWQIVDEEGDFLEEKIEIGD